ncbi:MAG: hypothetical protein ABIR91_03225 [Candidatus Saccharimonadales bacterium]
MNKRRLLSSLQRDGMSWALIVFVLLLVAGAAIYLIAPRMNPQTMLRLGDGVFSADIITKTNGYSSWGAESQSFDQAVARLYVYPRGDKWPFEVKSGSRALDLVWLNDKKEVVYIAKNIALTDSSGTTIYSPRQNARYVVALPVRTVEAKVINRGSVAVFDETVLENEVR